MRADLIKSERIKTLRKLRSLELRDLKNTPLRRELVYKIGSWQNSTKKARELAEASKGSAEAKHHASEAQLWSKNAKKAQAKLKKERMRI